MSKVCNKQFIALGHCEIWSNFTRTLYFHSPSARDNTVATCEISRTDLCNISLILYIMDTRPDHLTLLALCVRGNKESSHLAGIASRNYTREVWSRGHNDEVTGKQ